MLLFVGPLCTVAVPVPVIAISELVNVPFANGSLNVNVTSKSALTRDAGVLAVTVGAVPSYPTVMEVVEPVGVTGFPAVSFTPDKLTLTTTSPSFVGVIVAR